MLDSLISCKNKYLIFMKRTYRDRARHGVRATTILNTFGFTSGVRNANIDFLGLGDRFANGSLANTFLLVHDRHADGNILHFLDKTGNLHFASAGFLDLDRHTAIDLLVNIGDSHLRAGNLATALIRR